jgi:hypothetical protein
MGADTIREHPVSGFVALVKAWVTARRSRTAL